MAFQQGYVETDVWGRNSSLGETRRRGREFVIRERLKEDTHGIRILKKRISLTWQLSNVESIEAVRCSL